MKTLKEYINQLNIQDSLELHFYVEFILNESFKQSYFEINEKYGSYIGQKELIIDLAKEIWNVIQNNDPEDQFVLYKDDLKDYGSIFFNKLEIQLNNKLSYYNPNKSKFDSTSKLFDNVLIYINYKDIRNYKDLCSTLMHEMLHAYNHYQSYLTKSKFNLLDLTNKNSSYSKTVDANFNTAEGKCKYILNNIRQWEQNAYIGELSIELEKNKFNLSQYHNINDAYKIALGIFKKSNVWVRYLNLWHYLDQVKNGANEDQLIFAKTYNDINGTNLSFNKIYKKLDGILYKILLKIESKIPKIFYDFYQQSINIDEYK